MADCDLACRVPAGQPDHDGSLPAARPSGREADGRDRPDREYAVSLARTRAPDRRARKRRANTMPAVGSASRLIQSDCRV